MTATISKIGLYLAIAMIAALSSCAGQEGCKNDSDCPTGRYCLESSKECTYDCTVDQECPSGFVCSQNGRCVRGPCQSAADCANGQTCIDSNCEECNQDAYCGPLCADCRDSQNGTICVDDHCGCLNDSDCPQDMPCQSGMCQEGCQADCSGKFCGSDGCGGSCGTCREGASCEEGHCVCPHESCAGNCCGATEVCTPGGCCQPVCGDQECGPDPVCGAAVCGTCPDWGCNPLLRQCLTSQVVPMTANDAPEGIVESSPETAAGFEGYMAFDGTESPFYPAGSPGFPNFVSYQWTTEPLARPIVAYAVQFKTAMALTATAAPRNFKLYGYTGGQWTILDERLDEVDWTDGETRVYWIAQSGDYERYMYEVSVSNGDNRVSIGEIYLLY